MQTRLGSGVKQESVASSDGLEGSAYVGVSHGGHTEESQGHTQMGLRVEVWKPREDLGFSPTPSRAPGGGTAFQSWSSKLWAVPGTWDDCPSRALLHIAGGGDGHGFRAPAPLGGEGCRVLSSARRFRGVEPAGALHQPTIPSVDVGSIRIGRRQVHLLLIGQ